MHSGEMIFDGYREALRMIDSPVMLLGLAAGRIALVMDEDGYVSFERGTDARLRRRRSAESPAWTIYPRSRTIGDIREKIVRHAVESHALPPDLASTDARFSAELCSCALWAGADTIEEFASQLMVEDVADAMDDWGHVSGVIEHVQHWLAMEAPA